MTDDESQPPPSKPGIDWGKLAMSAAKGAGKLALSAGKAAAKTIGDAAKDLDQKLAENEFLSRRQGNFTAYIDAVTLFEAINKEFATARIHDRTKWWRSINPMPSYMELHCNASWINPTPQNAYGQSVDINTTVQLTLRFVADDEQTRLNFDYSVMSVGAYESTANELVKYTNSLLRAVCSRFPAPEADPT